MDYHAEMFNSLLTGLPADDQDQLFQILQRARDEQLHAKLNPPRRRARGSDGVLRLREESS